MAAKALALVAVLVLTASAAARADLASGSAAYHAGDYAAALSELLPLAEGGEPEAQYLVGMIHNYGSGDLHNLAQAAAWMRRAAEQGHGYAEYALGLLYEDGRGVKRSHREAMYWFRRAANKGVQPAINYLANLGGGGGR